MQASRELDALVAEKVMGWEFKHKFTKCPNPAFERCDYCLELNSEGNPLPIKCLGYPHYSTDISAAWEVVEKLSADGSWGLNGQDGLGWEAELNYQNGRFLQSDDTVSMGRGDTAPHAICLAALKAVEVE